MTLRKTIGIVTAVAAIGMSVNAQAAGPQQPLDHISVNVPFYDLNVHSDDGAKELYERLQRASRKACGLRVRGSVREMADARRCYTQSLSVAVEEVESEALNRLHSG